jgi:hypothetical protein
METQTLLALECDKPLCSRCGLNEVYYMSATMDLCEPCIWSIVQEDQVLEASS